jgi:hypothetical protein
MTPTIPDLRLVASNQNLDLGEKDGSLPIGFAPDLLDDDDLTEITRYGVPCGLRADLAELSAAGLIFTAKGEQYYTLSLRTHGVVQALPMVRDKDGLIELHANIFAAVRRKVRGDLYAEYQAGRIPAQDKELVEARLFGAIGEVLRALKRSVRFGEAGPNVIPVSFKEKRRS